MISILCNLGIDCYVHSTARLTRTKLSQSPCAFWSLRHMQSDSKSQFATPLSPSSLSGSSASPTKSRSITLPVLMNLLRDQSESNWFMMRSAFSLAFLMMGRGILERLYVGLGGVLLTHILKQVRLLSSSRTNLIGYGIIIVSEILERLRRQEDAILSKWDEVKANVLNFFLPSRNERLMSYIYIWDFLLDTIAFNFLFSVTSGYSILDNGVRWLVVLVSSDSFFSLLRDTFLLMAARRVFPLWILGLIRKE